MSENSFVIKTIYYFVSVVVNDDHSFEHVSPIVILTLRNFHWETRNLFVSYPNYNTELLYEWNKILFAGKSFYELYI